MDFVHVDNLAHAVERALAHGHPGGVYYITDGLHAPASGDPEVMAVDPTRATKAHLSGG